MGSQRVRHDWATFTSLHFATTISIQLHPCLLHQNKTPYSSSSYSPSLLPPLPPLASGNHQSTSCFYRLTVSGYFTRQNYKYVFFCIWFDVALGQEEKGTTEDEITGWHHWLGGREFEWTLGVGDGQGGLECCDSWGRRVGHDWVTELTEHNILLWKTVIHIRAHISVSLFFLVE